MANGVEIRVSRVSWGTLRSKDTGNNNGALDNYPLKLSFCTIILRGQSN